MSEKPQLDPGVSEKPDIPAKPPSGFVEKQDEECPTGRSESEQTLSQRVSRETSEASELTPEQKMLNDIMDRAMAKYQTKPQEDEEQEQEPYAQEESPSTEEKEAPPSPPEKNKPSSVYVYLAVLFGAAFVMLLLAYFVQQRNNAAVRDDLRVTTASREELLEDIKALETEKESLQSDNQLLEYETAQAREQYEAAREDKYALDRQLQALQSQYNGALILGYLERFCAERDYLMAAVVVEQCDHFFNPHSRYYPVKADPLPAAVVSRYFQLREDVVMEKTQCMVTQRTYDDRQEEDSYTEEVRIVPSASSYSQETVNTARDLWGILLCYHDDAEMAAWVAAQFCGPELNGPAQLNTRAFQPSTRALFEEVKGDLIAQGFLAETEEGGVAFTGTGFDGEPIPGGNVILGEGLDSFDFVYGHPEYGSPDEDGQQPLNER